MKIEERAQRTFCTAQKFDVQTFVKPRFFTFSLAVFSAPLKKSRASMFVYTFRTNEGVWTREEHRRSLFSRLLRSPNVDCEKKVLGRWHCKLYDAATLRARTPSRVKREQPLTLANIPPRRHEQHRISDAVVLDKCQRSQNVSQSARDSRVRLQLPRWYLQTALNVTSETFSSIEIRFKPKIMQRSVSLGSRLAGS